MIIDCHTHAGPPRDGQWDPQDLLRSMRDAGIDRSIVIAEQNAGVWATTGELLKTLEKHASLYLMANAHIDALDIAQINTLIGLLENRRVVGLKFYVGYEEYYPQNEKLFPLYEHCAAHGKPVMFHTGALERNLPGLLKYSHPLHVDEVAHLFPRLKIVIAHMGNPWIMDCAAVMAKNENVYADVSAFFDENAPVKESDIGIFVQRLADARRFLGSYEKFLFGTDWPLYSQKEYLAAVRALGLNAREEEAVLWRNASEIFGIRREGIEEEIKEIKDH